MNRLLLCSIVLIVAVSGCADNEPEVNASANKTPTPVPTPYFPVLENTTVYVEIKGSAFIPLTRTIKNGTTVRWTNLDSASHIINGPGFQSPPLFGRDVPYERHNWSYTFNSPGTFEYDCSLHPLMAHGWIIVE